LLIKIGSPFRISRRTVRMIQNQSRKSQAGFVLPTVTLVTVVVTLLVVTMVARSSDRARTASNARVEQVFANSSKPAVDRARAKIEALLNDPQLPRTTPPESIIIKAITSDAGKYTFPDETRLQVNFDFLSLLAGANAIPLSGTDGRINVSNSNPANNEFISTAWKFPVDTDNNGKFDSLGLYNIVFRTRPPFNSTPTPDRQISPLEARSLPMDESTLNGSGVCVTANSENTTTNEGWTDSGTRLKKSFFVYAVTTPIKDLTPFDTLPPSERSRYEAYSGNPSFSAIELQQDRARNPRNNYSIWFEGDLELARPATFRVNGRVYTRSSLMVGAGNAANPITFFQVSSPDSCYYTRDNSTMTVAGNVVEGDAVTKDFTLLNADVHLFKGAGLPNSPIIPANNGIAVIGDSTQSVTNFGEDVASNEFAYNQRIAALVEAATSSSRGSFAVAATPKPITIANITSPPDPVLVLEGIVKQINDEGLTNTADFVLARRRSYENYFIERTRKIPYIEVPANPTALQVFGTYEANASPVGLPALLTEIGAGAQLELSPPIEWVIPPDNNTSPLVSTISGAGDYSGRGLIAGVPADSLKIKENGTSLFNIATANPEDIDAANKETFLGDRLKVGNNLPVKWLKSFSPTDKRFVDSTEDNFFTTSPSDIKYNQINASADPNVADTDERARQTQGVTLESLGVSDRGGFWELSAADDPARSGTTISPNVTPTTGGLRVITGSGIYSRGNTDTFLPRFVTGLIDRSTDDPLTVGLDESLVDESGMPRNDPATILDERRFNGNTEATKFVVWPDLMPMSGGQTRQPGPSSNGSILNTSADIIGTETRKGDLQMRATAIYHYKVDAYDPALAVLDTTGAEYQRPVACVSSYYDPSTPTFARNADIAGNPAPWNPDPNGRSNNGIVYRFPAGATSAAGITTTATYTPATGIFSGYAANAINPYNGAVNLGDRLAYQANLIFPNGRFANEPLRNAMIKVASPVGTGSAAAALLTLAEQSALDSELCALQIMQIGGSPLAVETVTQPIPHGTFKEATFLDAREVKSLNRNENLTEAANGVGTGGLAAIALNRADIYDLEIEQRQPLEVRVTDIDMDRLRGSTITGGNNTAITNEFLLPYSGVVYASRDDALRDQSFFNVAAGNPQITDPDKRILLSGTDFRLDPTRRPNGIRLINGNRLWRSAINTANLGDTTGTLPVSSTTFSSFPFTPATRGQKGLILVSNLPVYIKAQRDPDNLTNDTRSGFNLHTQQEFGSGTNPATAGVLNSTWSNFYTRTLAQLNPNFACRIGQSPTCTLGDQWRQATVFSDAPSVMSAAFVDGFRSDGDFDARNNANTSTSINWQSSLNSNPEKAKDSSYVIQRRRIGYFNNNFVTSANWLPPAANATPTDNSNLFPANITPYANDGVAVIDRTEKRSSYNANGVTPIQRRVGFGEYNMEVCRKFPAEDCGLNDWVKDGAGTTALPSRSVSNVTPVDAPRFIDPLDERFPRRVSFLRYNDIYGDGNQSLVMSHVCLSSNGNDDNSSLRPIPIAVRDGNLTTGYTYPQPLGGVTTPFNALSARSYGDVPCPTLTTSIQINSLVREFEGRNRDNDVSLPSPVGSTDISSPAEYGTKSVNAPGGNSILPYARFIFRVQVNNLASATGNVTANIALTPQATSTATRAKVGAFPIIPDSYDNANPNTTNTNDPDVTDVLSTLYVAANCRNVAGALIPAGTPITSVVFRPSDPGNNVCDVAALVTQDIMFEGEENFTISLNTLSLNVVTGSALSREGIIRQDLNGPTIQNNDTSPPEILPPPAAACPAIPAFDSGRFNVGLPVPQPGSTNLDDGLITTSIQRRDRQTRVAGVSNCPPPTPPNPGGNLSLTPPVFGLLTPSFRYSGFPGAVILPKLAAAYPTTVVAPATTPYPLSDCGSAIADGSYICNSSTATTPPVRFSGNSIFGVARQVPPKPNATSAGLGGDVPMLPGMNRDRPADAPRALWFRTTQGDGDAVGVSSRTAYSRERNLFIYNVSWPTIRNSSSNLGNLNQPGRLVLPETACIDTSDGSVDALCTKQGSSTLINLNLPLNPHFPSTATSQAGVNGNRPASSYAVCGVTGNSQLFRSVQTQGRNDITSSSCDTGNGNPRTAINVAMGTTATGFRNANLDPASTTFLGQGSTVANFVSPPPLVTGRIDIDGITRLITIDAANTNALNKVNVINLTGLDGALTPNLITLPWNAACSATEVAQTTPKTLTGIVRLRANPNQPSPVFILRSCPTQDLLLENFKLQLDGVEPNNVFWVIPKTNLTAQSSNALTIKGGVSGSTVLSGNFLGIMPTSGGNKTTSTTLNIKNDAVAPAGINISLRGTRFLGFRAIRSDNAALNGITERPVGTPAPTGVDGETQVTAMTTTNQPIVLPVLQIHSPVANAAQTADSTTMPQPNLLTAVPPFNNSLTGEPLAGNATGRWTQRATDSEINAFFVGGISPSRSKVEYRTSITSVTPTIPPVANADVPLTGASRTGESGGGLPNFIRLLENWTSKNLQILGGFIQNSNSLFASAPFSDTAPYADASRSFTTSDMQTLFVNPVDIPRANQSLSNFNKVYQSETAQKIPFFAAPRRLWGYDVALLTQPVDLFAERFAASIPGANEFLREVDASDPWVKALLCAAQPATIDDTTRLGVAPNLYVSPALGSDRPTDCIPLSPNPYN